MNTNKNILEEIVTKENDNINITANNLTVDCITSTNNKFNLDSDGNLIVNSITTNIENSASTDFNSIYPIGSIYFNVTDINPSTLFGGSWERIAEGRCLIGSCDKGGVKPNNVTWGGPLNDNNYSFPLGEMAGQFKNQLASNEMPSHNHQIVNNTEGYVAASSGSKYKDYCLQTIANISTQRRIKTENVGGNEAHNNMPPYLVVNIWKRIA